MSRHRAMILTAAGLCLGSPTMAQLTFTGTTFADALLATGSASNPLGADLTGLNFGGAGMVAISPASASKGEFQSIIKFHLAEAAALFNASYGTNGWTVTAFSLELTSDYGTSGKQPNNPLFNVISGGNFVIEWLADDDWAEGTGTPNRPTADGVTYNSLASLLTGAHKILGTNTYTPPGDNVHVTYSLPLDQNLLAEVANGDDVSLRFYAADNQIGYLFNSYSYGRGNQPLLHVTAAPLLQINSGCLINDGFHLSGSAGANQSCQIQASADLAGSNWQTLGTVTADSAGVITFTDHTITTKPPQRFYRLAQ